MVLGLALTGCGARADSPTSAGESSARSAAADAVVLDITIAHGTVKPANAELSARINEPSPERHQRRRRRTARTPCQNASSK